MQSINSDFALVRDVKTKNMSKLLLSGQAYQLFIDSCRSQKTKETYEGSLRSYMLFQKMIREQNNPVGLIAHTHTSLAAYVPDLLYRFSVISCHLYYQLAAITQQVSLFAPFLSQAIVLDQANQPEQEAMLDPSICVREQSSHL
jgi:hypothetical protein